MTVQIRERGGGHIEEGVEWRENDRLRYVSKNSARMRYRPLPARAVQTIGSNMTFSLGSVSKLCSGQLIRCPDAGSPLRMVRGTSALESDAIVLVPAIIARGPSFGAALGPGEGVNLASNACAEAA